MNKKELKTFPVEQTGIIQILIKPTDQEEANVQLRFDFEDSIYDS